MKPRSPTATTTTAASPAAAAAVATRSSSSRAAPPPSRASRKSSSSSQRAAKDSSSSHHHHTGQHRRRSNKSSPPPPKLPSPPSPPPPPPPPNPPSRIVYGPGTIVRLPTELGRLRLASPLIVASPSRVALARRVHALIPNLDAHILDSAVVNARAQVVVDDAVARVTADRDCVISVGGASAVGLARAVSVRKGIPHICIPTTYSGSEVLHLFDCDVPTGPPDATTAAAAAAASRRPSSGGVCSIASPARSSDARSRTSGSWHSSRQSALSIASRDAKQRVKPAVIIYDEHLTSALPKRILIPTNTSGRQPRSADDSQSPSSKWSFMQLPGL